jgi:GNAT superfamily N-acetyltransferase
VSRCDGQPEFLARLQVGFGRFLCGHALRWPHRFSGKLIQPVRNPDAKLLQILVPAAALRRRLRPMLGAMRIEHAAIADAPRISALIRELSKPFLLSPSGEGAQPFLAAISESAIQAYVTASNFEYFVAEAQHQLVGVVAMRDNSHLFHFFVSEAFQGKGIGSKLWQMVMDKAIQSGNPGMFTVNSSLNAVPVYEKFGFVASGPVVQNHGIAFQPMQLCRGDNGA